MSRHSAGASVFFLVFKSDHHVFCRPLAELRGYHLVFRRPLTEFGWYRVKHWFRGQSAIRGATPSCHCIHPYISKVTSPRTLCQYLLNSCFTNFYNICTHSGGIRRGHSILPIIQKWKAPDIGANIYWIPVSQTSIISARITGASAIRVEPCQAIVFFLLFKSEKPWHWCQSLLNSCFTIFHKDEHALRGIRH